MKNHTSFNVAAFVPPGLPNINTGRAQNSLLSRSADLLQSPAGSVPASSPAHLTQPMPQRESSRAYPDGSVGCGKGTVVVQYRSDLRVHDHAALSHALEEGSRVVPVFVFDTRHFGSSPHGFQRTGKHRARFLIESVTELRSKLESLGGGLIVRVGIPEKIIPTICKSLGAKRVFLHKEISHEEQMSENKLEEALKSSGGTLQRFWSNTLYYEDDLPFAIAGMPDVYSDFREAVQTKSQVREPLQAPERLPGLPRGIDHGKIPTLAELGLVDSFTDDASADHGGVGRIRGGETEAMRKLQVYAEERQSTAAEYPSQGSLQGASVSAPDFACSISPWLALGCLSPRSIYETMKKTTRVPGRITESYTYFELVWRDFFRCITAKYSRQRVNAGAGSASTLTAPVS